MPIIQAEEISPSPKNGGRIKAVAETALLKEEHDTRTRKLIMEHCKSHKNSSLQNSIKKENQSIEVLQETSNGMPMNVLPLLL
jgi:hypothetical protein